MTWHEVTCVEAYVDRNVWNLTSSKGKMLAKQPRPSPSCVGRAPVVLKFDITRKWVATVAPRPLYSPKIIDASQKKFSSGAVWAYHCPLQESKQWQHIGTSGTSHPGRCTSGEGLQPVAKPWNQSELVIMLQSKVSGSRCLVPTPTVPKTSRRRPKNPPWAPQTTGITGTGHEWVSWRHCLVYPLSYRVPVRERYGSTLLPATREQHDQNCTQSH